MDHDALICQQSTGDIVYRPIPGGILEVFPMTHCT